MDALQPAAKPLGFLVVGVGSLGAQRAAACRVARGTNLVAVTDVDGNLARCVASRLGVAAVDFHEGLAHPDVDAVAVATPHADHVLSVRTALEAGKHVLCEKPLAIDANEAITLAELAEEFRLQLATGFNHRFYSPVRDAIALIEDGQIGKVMDVHATIGHMASREFLRGWHVDFATSGGGTLMDNGPHACDLIRRFLGDVRLVDCHVNDTLGLPDPIESEAFASFRNDDGQTAEIHSSWTQTVGYLTIEILGDRGHLRVETAPWGLSGRLADGSKIHRKYLIDRIRERIHHKRHGCECSLVLELESFANHHNDHATSWDGAAATAMVNAAYAGAMSLAREARSG